MDERGLVTCPGDGKRHREHDVTSIAQSVWRGTGGAKGGPREDERGTSNQRRPQEKHVDDVHCILDIVDVGCDTDVELAPIL